MNATAVGYTLYPGSLREQEMYREFGKIVEEAHEVGMAAIAWAYPRGSGVQDDLDTDTIAYGARIAAELGADMVKLKYNEDAEGFKWVIKNACKAKVLVSGGKKKSDSLKELEIAKEVLDLGATGIAIGRNVWQSDNPKGFAKAIADIVHKNKKAQDVYDKYLKQ
jgi:class I fructose-bisphosphate aldolase